MELVLESFLWWVPLVFDVSEIHLLQQYDPEINRFCCDLIALNGSKGCQNNYIMMQTGKKSDFMLCHVCQQDDNQTTFKMLVFQMDFGSIRAMLTL